MNSVSNNTTQQLLQSAASHHQAGRLDRATVVYEEVLSREPDNPDALNLLGLLHFHQGDYGQAARLISRAVEQQPDFTPYLDNLGMVYLSNGDYPAALEALITAERLEREDPLRCFNMGLVLEKLDRHDEAEQAYRLAIRLQPKDSDFHYNLGNLLMSKGQLKEAVAAYRDASACRPVAEGVLNNLGNALNTLGRRNEAVDAYRQALSAQPDDHNCGFNLGTAYLEMGQIQKAIECFQRLVEYTPNSMEANLALGRALNSAGRYDAAAHAFLKALKMNPGQVDARIGLASVSRALDPDGYRPELVNRIGELFRAPEVHPQALARLAANQLRHKYHLHGDATWNADQLTGRLAQLEGDRLLLDLLTRAVNTDPIIERLLIDTRRVVLWALAADAAGFPHSAMELAIALTHQCFTNEFVYLNTTQEEQLIAKLKNDIERTEPHALCIDARTEEMLLAVAMYQPLARLACAEALASISLEAWSVPFRSVVQRMLLAPLEEMALRRKVPVLREIRDPVSRSVRNQYEENPYPRWLTLTADTLPSYAKTLKRRFPHFPRVELLDGPVQVLAAGCGTGQEAAAIARSRPECDVIGLDLSVASLAYGMRMARELNIDNLSFIQGDLVHTSKLGRRFQVIECSGVLHHMANPEAGWQALVECLEPGGVMKVGLYSERASVDVIAARNVIETRGLKPSTQNIKKFRTEILNANPGDSLYPLRYSEDLYTLSACRDLLFHVHEQCFTLPRIQRALHILGLQFIGFDLSMPDVRHRYLAFNPQDQTMTDLSAWASFEDRYPQTFAAMYIFWVQKPN